jgi:putative spermidine/putrescine transport system permease protein
MMSAEPPPRLTAGRIALIVFAAVVGIWLFVPTLIVVPISFTSQASFEFPPPSWSDRWWSQLVTDEEWRDAALTSLLIAVMVSVAATVIGTAAALALRRGRLVLKGLINAAIIAPLVVPSVVVAVAVYATALDWKIVGTYTVFVLAHTALALPIAFIAVSASLRGYDERLDWSAASLGANAWHTFGRVTLPLIRPGVLTGALLAFILSFDEAVVSQFLVTPKVRTLPVLMFASVRDTIDPTVAAASTSLFVLTTCVMVCAGFVSRQRPTRRS